MSLRRALVVVVSASFLAVVPAVGPAVAGAAEEHDFNGDGYADLVIADWRATVGGQADAGGVHVLYGSPDGPRTTGVQLWTQDSAGVPNVAEPSDAFGYTWVAADFDGDGYDDLALGATGEDIGPAENAGLVTVLYGSGAGLVATGSAAFHQDTPYVPDTNEDFDRFGAWSLGAGDFDGDGKDDLVVGAPNESVGATGFAGAVWILPGSSDGVQAQGTRLITQATDGMAGDPEVNGAFGYLGFGTGDFDGDGYDDLTISASAMTVAGQDGAGGFYVLEGSQWGVRTTTARLITQATAGVPGVAAINAGFAYGGPGVGDFDNDGYDDLAVAAHYDSVGAVDDAGRVFVLRGTSAGLTTTGVQTWHQDVPGVVNAAEDGDQFGELGLVTGDFDGDGKDDLAISVSLEDVGAIDGAGAVALLYGTQWGLSATGNQLFTQASDGIAGSPAVGRRWSEAAMFALDTNGDGRDDLSVPSYRQPVQGAAEAGVSYLLFGTGDGVSGIGSRTYSRATSGIVGPVAANANFGQCCF